MTIIFEPEGTTLFAVAYNEIVKGYQHDELLFGEIDEALGGYMVRFEDAWHSPEHFSTLQEAKDFITKNHNKHTPRSMGRNYYLG